MVLTLEADEEQDEDVILDQSMQEEEVDEFSPVRRRRTTRKIVKRQLSTPPLEQAGYRRNMSTPRNGKRNNDDVVPESPALRMLCDITRREKKNL